MILTVGLCIVCFFVIGLVFAGVIIVRFLGLENSKFELNKTETITEFSGTSLLFCVFVLKFVFSLFLL